MTMVIRKCTYYSLSMRLYFYINSIAFAVQEIKKHAQLDNQACFKAL